MRDQDGVLSIPLDGPRVLRVFVMLFFLSFGAALLALFVGTVLYPDPGRGPDWTCLLVGLPWTLFCVVGLGTRQYAEIDGNTREARRVVSHFGLRRVHTLPSGGVSRIGVRPTRHRSGSIDGYEIALETRDPIPFLGQGSVWRLHWQREPEKADADARLLAERLGVPCSTVSRGKEPGT